MWYFSWILGTAFACTIAVLFGIWYELRHSTHLKNKNL